MIKFVRNKEGVKALLKRDETAHVCMSYAVKMQAIAGPGYEVEERRYPERTGAAIFPATEEAVRDNLENNTLEKVRRSV